MDEAQAVPTASTAADEDRQMYGTSPEAKAEIEKNYPKRPHNHSLTLPFHTLYQNIFNPLKEQQQKPVARSRGRSRSGATARPNPHQLKGAIVGEYIARWRQQVGPDIYPAFRLIVPDRDRDRALYGLKEKTIGRILIKILRISKDSADGLRLLNWKLPGRFISTATTTGNFAGRCFEEISKRPIRTTPGDMTIGEVNVKLDQLGKMTKEADQVRLMEQFYFRMNSEEMMWLIRIILRQMKIGLSEKTIFHRWHPDAETLFSVSSSLRKVCWDLTDPERRLDEAELSVGLMRCFQPQLAAFQYHSFTKIIDRMRMPDDDQTFWIEEKLDGERMQMHMMKDVSVPGGFRFAFWSRNGKDYSYLYGSSFEDSNSALTRYLRGAFNPGAKNLILDGEMITWDMQEKAVVAFGTLKSAALAEQSTPFSNTQRPLYRVFDCLYLNDKSLTGYTLRERRKALAKVVKTVEYRIEIHPYEVGKGPSDIDTQLRKVVEQGSEGLVIKNPRSLYRLNVRHDDWIKVKPEYMSSFGEELDVVIVGGYYGNGRRGGILASYLCGLRVNHEGEDEAAEKVHSFVKVGGGFSASDYADIRHRTDGKWNKWDSHAPPFDVVELAGGVARQLERPDMWIRPRDSVVISVKAASVTPSDTFRAGVTLRFPRFKSIRFDKTWHDALSLDDFRRLRANAEGDRADQAFEIDDDRKIRRAATASRNKKRAVEIVGASKADGDAVPQWRTPDGGAAAARLFERMTVYVMTDAIKPVHRTKAEIEQLVTAHGGRVVQTHTVKDQPVVCIADRELVKVGSLCRLGDRSVIRPVWLYDCIDQVEADARCLGSVTTTAAAADISSFLLPLEPRHLFFTAPDEAERVAAAVDEFGDSFARDTCVAELRTLLEKMSPRDEGGDGTPSAETHPSLIASIAELVAEKDEDDSQSESGDAGISEPFLFLKHRLFLDLSSEVSKEGIPPESDIALERVGRLSRSLGGAVESRLIALNEGGVTHLVIGPDRSRVRQLRMIISQ